MFIIVVEKTPMKYLKILCSSCLIAFRAYPTLRPQIMEILLSSKKEKESNKKKIPNKYQINDGFFGKYTLQNFQKFGYMGSLML